MLLATLLCLPSGKYAEGNPYLAIVAQPLQHYDLNDAIVIKIAQQFVYRINASLVDSFGRVVNNYTWQNPNNIKYQEQISLQFTASAPGQMRIILRVESSSFWVDSNNFVVSVPTPQCQIVKPDGDQYIFQNLPVLLVTKYCIGQSVIINNVAKISVESDEEEMSIASKGNTSISIGSEREYVYSLPLMSFSDYQYTAFEGETVNVLVNNMPPEFEISLDIDYEVLGQQIVVPSCPIGSHVLTLTSKNVIPRVLISAEIIAIGMCSLELDEDKQYFIGDTIAPTQQYCDGNYVIVLPNQQRREFTTTFELKSAGKHIIMIENKQVAIEVYGIVLSLLTPKITELKTAIEVSYLSGMLTKRVVVQIECRDNNMAYPLLASSNTTLQFYFPRINCAYARIRLLDPENPQIWADSAELAIQPFVANQS